MRPWQMAVLAGTLIYLVADRADQLLEEKCGVYVSASLLWLGE